MNRTRKIAAAAVGTAVVLVIIAMVLLNPTVHTQTPAATVPPTNGGTGPGAGGASGTAGTGAGNGTSTGCTASGNRTGENGDHDEGDASTCGASSVDHDAMGDKMSSEHRSIHADEHIHFGLGEDLIALAQLAVSGAASAAHGLASMGTAFASVWTGLMPSVFA